MPARGASFEAGQAGRSPGDVPGRRPAAGVCVPSHGHRAAEIRRPARAVQVGPSRPHESREEGTGATGPLHLCRGRGTLLLALETRRPPTRGPQRPPELPWPAASENLWTSTPGQGRLTLPIPSRSLGEGTVLRSLPPESEIWPVRRRAGTSGQLCLQGQAARQCALHAAELVSCPTAAPGSWGTPGRSGHGALGLDVPLFGSPRHFLAA